MNSPKQVSTAIFGRPQTATKRVLEQAVRDTSLEASKQELAQKILEYREVRRMLQNNEQPARGVDDPDGSGDPRRSRRLRSALVASSSDSSDSVEATKSHSSNKETFNYQQPPKHEKVVDSLFRPASKIDPYWKEPLLKLSKPTARTLLSQLDPFQCPNGYDPNARPTGPYASLSSLELNPSPSAVSTPSTQKGKRGTFLSYVREQKEAFPQCVILTRCGDFYECFGIDAILLVEYAGLNSMGGKARAGCPWRNVQATLDALTTAGFSVAVFEEIQADTKTTKKAQLKTRVLTQVVSPASPTYLFDQWQLEDRSLEGLPASRPCVGIVATASGYTLVEVSLEEWSVRVSERLTPEAVSCRLAAYPPAEPLLYIPSPLETRSSLPFLPATVNGYDGTSAVESHISGRRVRTRILPPSLVPGVSTSEIGSSDSDRYSKVIVDTFLQWAGPAEESSSVSAESSSSPSTPFHQKRPTVDDFSFLDSSASRSNSASTNTRTNPLYVETASQLGLLGDETIPPLVSYLVDDSAPASTKRFLQRYLLVPPPPEVADSFGIVIKCLMDETNPVMLPPLSVPPLGKVLSLLRAGQAGARLFGELLQTLHAAEVVLQGALNSTTLDSLELVVEHESGLSAKRESLMLRSQAARATIEEVINPNFHAFSNELDRGDVISTDTWIPASFFERNERMWRGRIRSEQAPEAYDRVEQAVKNLISAVQTDFIGTQHATFSRTPIMQDIFDNLISLKDIPPMEATNLPKDEYFHPRDRNGKIKGNRYTTEKVQIALSEYIAACEHATNEISMVLTDLAEGLYREGHIPAIVQTSHLNLILSTAFHHASKATQLGWAMADIYEPSSPDDTISLVDLWPYWMDGSRSVSNSFDMTGMFLLTAPNMSGKSTLMRSTAAAALLTACGLCAPLKPGSRIPRFDTLFLRGASADVPSENKSAFGAEIGDIASLMRSCGSSSLVFVDELGRGTSPKDGTRIAGAVLEAMAKAGMKGMFATHLHDILDLPLEHSERIFNKRMTIDGQVSGDGSCSLDWTYRLEDGVCTDSLALLTAERFGLPEDIIERARELEEHLPDRLRRSSTSSIGEETLNQGGYGGTSPVEDSGEFSSKMTSSTSTPSPVITECFEQAKTLAERVTGQSSITIHPRWSPPPSFLSKSCVYVLQLAYDPPRYYVGETDCLPKRLDQHRRKGDVWLNSRAVAMVVESKTEARAQESLLIQELAQAGFSMESITDGRSLRHFRN